MSRGSSVGTAKGYGIYSGGLIPGRGKRFLFSTAFEPAMKAHTASYPMGTECSFSGSKAFGHEAEHSPPSNAEVNNCGAISPLSHKSSWCDA
jgi:hypothetical protein